MASCGKKAFAASPACFLSARSMEQIKVDVAYSGMNVKLIGISGGISYGALGMTHHSTQDIAAIASIPGMRVYLPSDRHQTGFLIKELLKDDLPVYIRVGRNPVEDVYTNDHTDFILNKAVTVCEGSDITIIACGEMVYSAMTAAKELADKSISARVIDMYCVKPVDRETVEKAARETKAIITVEEHSYIGGLGAMVSQIVCAANPVKVKNLALPDTPVIAGTSKEVFAYYGLDTDGIIKTALELMTDG